MGPLNEIYETSFKISGLPKISGGGKVTWVNWTARTLSNYIAYIKLGTMPK